MKAIIAITVILLASTAQAQVKNADIERAVDAAAAAAAAAEAAADAAADADMVMTDAYNGSFDPSRDAAADVDAALAAARTSGKHVMVVFGGDWCHDSLALVDALASPRAQAMLAARYETVMVHVPFSPRERDSAVAHRFGLGNIEGTPTVLILRPDGTATNLEDAPRWRNAASRKPAAIVRQIERAAPAVGD